MTGRTPVAGLDPSSHVLHGSASDGKPDSKIPFIALIKPLKQMGNLFFIQAGPIVLYTDNSPFPSLLRETVTLLFAYLAQLFITF